MAVAQVPGRFLCEEHLAVIRLGVHYDTSVLNSIEKLLRPGTVAAGVDHGTALELDEPRHGVVLARFGETRARQETIRLFLPAEVVETGVMGANPIRRNGIRLLKIPEHCFH